MLNSYKIYQNVNLNFNSGSVFLALIMVAWCKRERNSCHPPWIVIPTYICQWEAAVRALVPAYMLAGAPAGVELGGYCDPPMGQQEQLDTYVMEDANHCLHPQQ